LNVGIEGLIPKLATLFPKYRYDDRKRVLVFNIGDVFVRIEPRAIKVSGVRSLEEGEEILARAKGMMNQVFVTAWGSIGRRLGLESESVSPLAQEFAEGDTLEDFVRRLAVQFKEFGEITFSPSSSALTPGFRVLLNDKVIPDYDWRSTRLMPGDRSKLRRRH
jgi:hypothetical protein